MNIRKIFFIILFYPLSLTALAQMSPQDEARQLFENGDYAQALPKFKRLLTLFPKDARYHYYTGVCMVETNTNLIKSIEYLTFALNKNVPANVNFFLGKAYHYLYRFNDAIEAYRKFKREGSRQEIDKLDCNHQIEMAENGLELTTKQCLFNVYQLDTVSRENLFDYYNQMLRTGQFQKKQVKELPFLKGRTIWRYISKGNSIYESSFASKNNWDLFVIQETTGKNTSKPKNLGSIINSNYDEDYAWYNVGDSCLYFSSKGHNSMGGYDIFKSKYNPQTGCWSEPVNLGFPINSPYDDILFVPSGNTGQATFASNRNTQGAKFVVYTISYSGDFAYSDISSGSEYILLSNLKIGQLKSINQPGINTVNEIRSNSAKWHTGTSMVSTYPASLAGNQEYNRVLTSAMRYQVQSDSLFRKADELRQKGFVINDDAGKNRLKKEAYSLEVRSKEDQKIADEYFAKVVVFESGAGSNLKDSIPAISESMAKRVFSTKTKSAPVQPDSGKGNNSTVLKSKKLLSSSKIIYEFKVMSPSPYKQLSDIPLNQVLPQNIIFRIQMGAFSKTIEPDRFKGIVPIYGETIPNSMVIKYYAGLFNRFSDAEKALNKIREYGFKDAYIVSYYNGKSIPLSRAKEMQNDVK